MTLADVLMDRTERRGFIQGALIAAKVTIKRKTDSKDQADAAMELSRAMIRDILRLHPLPRLGLGG